MTYTTAMKKTTKPSDTIKNWGGQGLNRETGRRKRTRTRYQRASWWQWLVGADPAAPRPARRERAGLERSRRADRTQSPSQNAPGHHEAGQWGVWIGQGELLPSRRDAEEARRDYGRLTYLFELPDGRCEVRLAPAEVFDSETEAAEAAASYGHSAFAAPL